MDYDSGRTIDYSYDSGTGKLESIDFSDLGEYGINYSATTGNISSITYPNSSGIESYTYSGGLGKLSSITYPGNKELEFTWNDKNQITRLEYNDYNAQTIVIYALTYNHAGKIAGYTKSEDSIQTANWSFYYGPFGLEKAVRSTSPSITEDFTVDPSGRILSMTYTEAGGQYNGEYYFYYDNFGNTVLLTNSSGEAKYSARYDLQNGKMVEEWNPNGLVLVGKMKGASGAINFEIGDNSVVFASSCSSGMNMVSNFANVAVGGGVVRPLGFTLPPGMATCGNSCKISSGKDYPDPNDPNKDLSNNLDQFMIIIDVNNDINSSGQFSNKTKKELEKGGLNPFQIQTLEEETNYCKHNRNGAKLRCSSVTNPRNPSANCCLECSCLTSKNDEHTKGSDITICEDYWTAG